MFTVLFAIPRTAGWLAQWQELVTDPEQKISRPRQLYTGVEHRRLEKQEAAQAMDFSSVSGAPVLTDL
jgi:citrate synthase